MLKIITSVRNSTSKVRPRSCALTFSHAYTCSRHHYQCFLCIVTLRKLPSQSTPPVREGSLVLVLLSFYKMFNKVEMSNLSFHYCSTYERKGIIDGQTGPLRPRYPGCLPFTWENRLVHGLANVVSEILYCDIRDWRLPHKSLLFTERVWNWYQR